MDKNFPHKIKLEILERDNYRCRKCGTRSNLEYRAPHHCFFKSELFREIVNWKENGCVICFRCHNEAHARGPADYILKSYAIREFERNPNTKQVDLEELYKIFKQHYGKRIPTNK